MRQILIEALAWYYDDIYDGPESNVPQWVLNAREALADQLVGRRDAQTREEAVDEAIRRAS